MNEKKRLCHRDLELSENSRFFLDINYKMIMENLYIFYKYQKQVVLY